VKRTVRGHPLGRAKALRLRGFPVKGGSRPDLLLAGLLAPLRAYALALLASGRLHARPLQNYQRAAQCASRGKGNENRPSRDGRPRVAWQGLVQRSPVGDFA
jgi:hypothetical protein